MHEQILNNFPLVNYVLARGGREIKKNEYLLTCPQCVKEKLTVNVSKKLYHCWTCEKRVYDAWHQKYKIISGAGNILNLVMLLEKITLEEAVKFVTKYSAFQLEKMLNFVDLNLQEKLVSSETTSYLQIPYPEYSHKITNELPYLRERGITLEDVNKFRLFYCSAGRYANRLMFPVIDNDKLICFQGRAMYPAIPGIKYVKALAPLHIAGCARTSDVLFNLDVASTYSRVCITEGPISAIHCGYDSVCSFGKRLSVEQIKYLLKYKIKAIDLYWDGPSPTEPNGAQIEMLLIAPLLSQIFDLRIVLSPKGDPGDYSKKENSEFRSKSVHYSEKKEEKNNLQKI